MSALRKPDFESQYYSPQVQFQPQKNSRSPLTGTPQKRSQKLIENRSFPQQNKLPKNLKFFSRLQQCSFIFALVSLTGSLSLYASTVRIPELWSEEYRNLENLQRQERELIAINEKIKYQIAREASTDDRLSISKPESAVFIAPAKIELKPEIVVPEKSTKVSLKANNLGY